MIADTSFLFALYSRPDAHHAQALSKFGELMQEEGRMLVPSEVAVELCSLITYRMGLDEALAVVDRLSQDPVFILEGFRSIYEISGILRELGAKISYTDAAVLLHSQITRQEILTFDRQMQSLCKRLAKG